MQFSLQYAGLLAPSEYEQDRTYTWVYIIEMGLQERLYPQSIPPHFAPLTLVGTRRGKALALHPRVLQRLHRRQPRRRVHRQQLRDDVLRVGGDVLPDRVVGVVGALLDLLKQDGIVVVV